MMGSAFEAALCKAIEMRCGAQSTQHGGQGEHYAGYLTTQNTPNRDRNCVSGDCIYTLPASQVTRGGDTSPKTIHGLGWF